jgi:RimJ/RimL family protein N-acetyltransferase
MALKQIEAAEIPLVAGWLGEPANYQWLDFGRGVQRIDPVALRIMLQRDIHLLRTFTPDGDDGRPVGVVGLSDINRNFGTATLWVVLGDKQRAAQARRDARRHDEYGRRGLTTQALSEMLSIAFDELGLAAVNAWTLENNWRAQRLLDQLNFRLIGRQRSCHVMDGRRYDRLWYDLLAEEYS